MHKLYIFSKTKSGYKSVHSLTREQFDSENHACPSMDNGDLILVRSDLSPRDAVPIVVIPESLDEHSQNQELCIETHVAFDNRHRDCRIPTRIGPSAGLMQFCKLAGVEPVDGQVWTYFLGPHREQKFNIHNAFSIRGKFLVKDPIKFKRAYELGVGSRKSYGFGLIKII